MPLTRIAGVNVISAVAASSALLETSGTRTGRAGARGIVVRRMMRPVPSSWIITFAPLSSRSNRTDPEVEMVVSGETSIAPGMA